MDKERAYLCGSGGECVGSGEGGQDSADYLQAELLGGLVNC